MRQSAQAQPSPTSSSFAGLLAALALPSHDAADRDPASTAATRNLSPPGFATPAWSGSDLGEGVETLSYERALRAHSRYKPACEGLPVAASAAPQAVLDHELRRVSVTIRLSKAECARLRQRAAEAGVTVSAYLRSCTFEAEALRAQVKKALADLRSAGVQGTEGLGKAGNKGPSHPSGHKSPAGGPGREQGNKGLKQRGNEGIRLARVLAHIGRLCVGLSAGKSS